MVRKYLREQDTSGMEATAYRDLVLKATGSHKEADRRAAEHEARRLRMMEKAGNRGIPER